MYLYLLLLRWGIFTFNMFVGTFDRLHVAHKLLLSDAILRTSEILTVGVTEESMTHGKLSI